MSNDLYSKLKDSMAYGTLTRGELPGEIEDYHVTLEQKTYSNSPSTLKLKFTPKRGNMSEFYIKVDEVKDPAHPLILIKYSEEENKVNAKATSKIKKKMILSIEKEEVDREELLEKEEEESDSDIPRGRPLHFYFDEIENELEGKPRKRNKPADESDS